MIVVTNRLTVAAGFEQQFEDRFSNRAGLVDSNPGFVRNEIQRLKPGRFDREAGGWVDEPTEHAVYEVSTWWEPLEHFTAWTRSPSFRQAHANPAPEGMFAAPGQLVVREVVQSTS